VEAIRFEELDLAGLVERVLAGDELDRPDAHAILNCPDERLAELLAATRICPEDCGYCSQSSISRADIPVYKMQSVEELCGGARMAVASGGATAWCAACAGPARAKSIIWPKPASASAASIRRWNFVSRWD
jgi:biotin synthase